MSENLNKNQNNTFDNLQTDYLLHLRNPANLETPLVQYWYLIVNWLIVSCSWLKLTSGKISFQLWLWGTDRAQRYFLLRRVDFVCGQENHHRPKNHHRVNLSRIQSHTAFWGAASWHNGDGNWNNYIVLLLNNPLFGPLAKSSTGWNWKTNNPEEVDAKELFW